MASRWAGCWRCSASQTKGRRLHSGPIEAHMRDNGYCRGGSGTPSKNRVKAASAGRRKDCEHGTQRGL